MGFISAIGHILNIYYYCGLSPFRVDSTTKKLCLNQWTKYIHVVVTLALAATILIECHSVHHGAIVRQMEQLLITIYEIFDIFRCLNILFHSTLLFGRIKDNLLNFSIIESVLAAQFKHSINYNCFCRKHLRKLGIVLFVYVVHWATYLARQYESKDWSTAKLSMPAIGVKLLQSTTFLYITFYVDALAFFMAQLNAVIDHHGDLQRFHPKLTKNDIKQMLHHLQCYKSIHFQLWQISECHNSIFGWCTISMLLDTLIDLVYCAFWTFDNMRRRTVPLKVLLPMVAMLDMFASFAIFSESCQSVAYEVCCSKQNNQHIQ